MFTVLVVLLFERVLLEWWQVSLQEDIIQTLVLGNGSSQGFEATALVF